MLIDSSGHVRSAIVHMLRQLGVDNIRAVGVNDRVLQLIAEGNFDILLLGHNGSDVLTGVQILEEARYRGFIKASACWVFMTSDASQELVLHAIDSHPDMLLTKPFTIEDLKYRLDTLVRRKDLLRPVDTAVEAGDLETAIALCRDLVSRQDPLYETVQQVRGRLLIKAGRYDEAKALFENRFWQSQDKEAGFHLAEALAGLSRVRDAIEVLQGLVAQYPLLIAAYDLLATLHERLGEVDVARDVLQEATARSPLGIPRQMALGRVATQTRSLDTAEGAYRKSIQLGQRSVYRSPEPYLRLANVHRLALQDADERQRGALQEAFDRALNQASFNFPRDERCKIQSALLRGQLLRDKGDESGAERCEREAEHINSQLETPLDLKREGLLLSADPVPMLEPAPPAPPAPPEPANPGKRDSAMSEKVNRLGVKHYMASKTSQAFRYFGLAIEYDPANPFALLNLAQLYLELARDSENKRKERLRMFDRYLRLTSQLPLQEPALSRQRQLLALRHQPLAALPGGCLAPLLG
ncbi:hypothetical protein GCM10011348_31780 [Marinobacterium nitratireducens]|uniref:Response regulatory domain-containing protein n=2 Tax=Marinobacterium nitratireducens TaxID=518897 RepID=A0A917ZJU3_9GAMM|nr:hypothetical protein GCM10011348_31780 [Marinobacterium nitratireducens]